MNVLFIGDIVGETATCFIAGHLPALRRRYQIDLTIANAENCAATGTGMTSALIDLLLRSGVDVITSGNHAWDGAEAEQILRRHRVLRPHNMPAGTPGTGVLYLDVAGEPVTVLNLGDAAALSRQGTPSIPADPLPTLMTWRATPRLGTVIVDYHGEHVWEKQAFAYAVDGEAAAVLGTHTHEATHHLHLLPGGTALVTEVGMTGPTGGVQGFSATWFIARLQQEPSTAVPLAQPVEGPISLGAVVLRIAYGKTIALERVQL